MPFTVVIVGRPNVGKSTLFNRLVGRRAALVHDTPGLTRDWREGEASLGGLSFRVIDTAGLEEGRKDGLEARVKEQTSRALAEADLVLMVVDARAGITPLDEHFADLIRAVSKPTLLVANKSEGRAGDAGFYESYSLGLGDPIAISAEHALGLGDLYDAIAVEHEKSGVVVEEAAPKPSGRIEIAIVGRPNVGKSTLINRLLGEDRQLTGPEPGTTRDAIEIDWTYDGRLLRLVDTAGIRRRAKFGAAVEQLAVDDSERAIGKAGVVILVLDAREMLHRHDLRIAEIAIEEGRALVIAANKWDLVADRNQAARELRERIETSLPQVRGLPAVTISAASGEGLDKLMEAVFRVHGRWQREITTGALNRWLEGALEGHQPPMAGGRRVKFRYMTQTAARPPTFALFTNLSVGKAPDSYIRYLANGLRDAFDLDGVPIRIRVRRSKNPFAPK
ncbi:MAG: ribosome biogenesis GTPase Der [Alphaproteobacteria bacterium]